MATRSHMMQRWHKPTATARRKASGAPKNDEMGSMAGGGGEWTGQGSRVIAGRMLTLPQSSPSCLYSLTIYLIWYSPECSFLVQFILQVSAFHILFFRTYKLFIILMGVWLAILERAKKLLDRGCMSQVSVEKGGGYYPLQWFIQEAPPHHSW